MPDVRLREWPSNASSRPAPQDPLRATPGLFRKGWRRKAPFPDLPAHDNQKLSFLVKLPETRKPIQCTAVYLQGRQSGKTASALQTSVTIACADEAWRRQLPSIARLPGGDTQP